MTKECCDDKLNKDFLEILTPYPRKRSLFERFLNRYNHIMELIRTVLAFITVSLQVLILYKLFI